MLITVENWEQLVLGFCVLSLSWDLAEHLSSRRALQKKDAQKGKGSSAVEGGFQVWFFGDAFLGAAGGSSEVVSPGACFLFTNASCNEEQFIRTFFLLFFLLIREGQSESYMKETWMVCDRREAAICSWLSSRVWVLGTFSAAASPAPALWASAAKHSTG